jgi:hypothetical protein
LALALEKVGGLARVGRSGTPRGPTTAVDVAPL